MRRVRPFAAFLPLALSLGSLACVVPPQEGPPAPADDSAVVAAEKAARAAADALKAATDAREDADRARRDALMEAVRADEDLVDALRAAGKDLEADVVAARLANRQRELGALVLAMAGGRPVPTAGPAPAPVPTPRRPRPVAAAPDVAQGLPPLVPNRERKHLDAVEAGLSWLSNCQSEDGRWDADGFGAAHGDGVSVGPGGPLYDIGVTGIATLSFLAAGETHRSERYGATVKNALRYLASVQDAEGCFGPRVSQHFIYNHGFATLAMTEAYGLSQSPLFKERAQRGIDFILASQNPYLGWRYGVRPQDNDTIVTGLMVMALESAKMAGLEVPDETFRGALAWLDKVTDPETGRVGYTARGNGPARPQDLIDAFPSEKSECTTAVGCATRLLAGGSKDDPVLLKGLARLGKALPEWNRDAGTTDPYYWWWGTIATRRAGGHLMNAWSTAIQEAFLPWQRGKESGAYAGSWDPAGPWGGAGGRVYATAIAILTLRTIQGYRRTEPDATDKSK